MSKVTTLRRKDDLITTEEMKVGEVGYIEPWAVYKDDLGYRHLNLLAGVSRIKQDSFRIKIERTNFYHSSYEIADTHGLEAKSKSEFFDKARNIMKIAQIDIDTGYPFRLKGPIDKTYYK